MFVPRPQQKYSDADTTRYHIDGDGFIDFVQHFKYLGSLVAPDLKATKDVDNRIKSASAAFARLRHVFRNRTITLATKGIIYDAIITSILLYGCESWNLCAADLKRLQSLHRRCVRETCHVSMRQTRSYRIRSSHLNAMLGVKNLEDSYRDRLLRWVGVICRMPLDRLPRRLMTSWVQHPRVSGGQQVTWGKAVKRALTICELPTAFKEWNALAQDAREWRRVTHSRPPDPPPDWKKNILRAGCKHQRTKKV